MLTKVTSLAILLILLIAVTRYTQGKKDNKKKTQSYEDELYTQAKKPLSEEDKDKLAAKVAKHMTEKEEPVTTDEEPVEYIEGSSLRKPTKEFIKQRAEKRYNQFMDMNKDMSVADAYEKISKHMNMKGQGEMRSIAKEMKKAYKIHDDLPPGERMEKMVTMLQEKNMNKLVDNLGEKFSQDKKVLDALKTVKKGFKLGSKSEGSKKEQKVMEKKGVSNKKIKAGKKEKSQIKNTIKTKGKEANKKKTDKIVKTKTSDKSADSTKQINKDKNKAKNKQNDESKSKANKNDEDAPVKSSSCTSPNEQNHDNIKTNKDSEFESCTAKKVDKLSTFEGQKEDGSAGKIPSLMNSPPSASKENRGERGENILINNRTPYSSKQNRGETGENLSAMNPHNTHKQNRGDTGEIPSQITNPNFPRKKNRGDTGDNLLPSANTHSAGKQNRGETWEHPSPDKQRSSDASALPSAIPSFQELGDTAHNGFPGRGSQPEKGNPGNIKRSDADHGHTKETGHNERHKKKVLGEKDRSPPTGNAKSKKNQHWTGEGYDFGNTEPLGPPSSAEKPKYGKLSKALPLFSLLSSKEDRTKGAPKRREKVSRRAARGDTGSVDNLMESMQDHGGWNGAWGRKDKGTAKNM
ncbi:unnamed protein product [Meganyctiphanes norvegica]|uniref:Uncharacterized protein n=1 Tax=Meganyctiphanes norvegica TaxID=48144 RepID=A0AAV2QT07_MEGNR